jgi:hypothetical protein
MTQVRAFLLNAVCIVGAITAAGATAEAAWIDAATGQPVQVEPYIDPHTGGRNYDYASGHAVYHGHNLFWDTRCGTWRDAGTNNEVQVEPYIDPHTGGRNYDYVSGHAVYHGHNLFWQPCPPPQAASSTGLYLGGELVKNWGWVRSTERLAATDVQTNQFTDRADPVGGGFLIGYKFAPWANSVIVSPFGSFDFIDAPVNHTFAGGSYLGTTAKFMGTFGVKAGPQIGAGVWLYGIAGVSVLNETLNINFIPVSSSQSAWVAGGTVGVGGAWQPAFLQGYGHPVSLFAEYQHTWWQDANFNAPAASPFFNYTFVRQDDVVKFGFTVDLSPAAPPPAAGPRYVKALPAK